MAKQGMKRPEGMHTDIINKVSDKIENKAKAVKDSAENPISSAYSVIDNDLARDNIENDMPAADLQDL